MTKFEFLLGIMDKVFISYHFDDNGRRLANEVKDLVRYHNIQHHTGQRLGGNSLSDEIKERIAECDGLICLLTEREADRNSDWVRDERSFAATEGKPTIALTENGAGADGMYTGNERILYDPAKPAEALLELSKTLGLWQQQRGRKLVAQLEPSDVADLVSNHLDDVKVQYRLYEGSGRTDWQRASARPKGDAVLVYLSGIRSEDTDVELEVRYGDKHYKSRVESQYFRIKLSED